MIPDDFRDELATCFNVKGRGLLVITSCSHRGVVNTVRRAMEVSGVKKVHAVAGGFHLAPQKDDYVRQTVAALKEVDPDFVIPMHCTGDVFIEIPHKEMPEKFIRSYTGSQYVFGGCPYWHERPTRGPEPAIETSAIAGWCRSTIRRLRSASYGRSEE